MKLLMGDWCTFVSSSTSSPVCCVHIFLSTEFGLTDSFFLCHRFLSITISNYSIEIHSLTFRNYRFGSRVQLTNVYTLNGGDWWITLSDVYSMCRHYYYYCCYSHESNIVNNNKIETSRKCVCVCRTREKSERLRNNATKMGAFLFHLSFFICVNVCLCMPGVRSGVTRWPIYAKRLEADGGEFIAQKKTNLIIFDLYTPDLPTDSRSRIERMLPFL